MLQKIYPRSKDKETVYLKSVITNPKIGYVPFVPSHAVGTP